jgi:hypothetical protein
MTITGIHQQDFTTRLNVTETATAALMNLLQTKKHFKSYRKSSKEEDLGGIDWWVVYPGQTEEVPIQFKLRDRQKDIPLCRFQPFYGTDSPKTVVGRDYRCIEGKQAAQYYVAVRNGAGKFTEIYKISCDTLRPLIMSLDEEWQKVEGVFDTFALKFFDAGRVGKWLESGIWNKRVFRGDSGCEVWWKKNRNEKFPKFNMYVPYSYKDWETQLSESESNSL